MKRIKFKEMLQIRKNISWSIILIIVLLCTCLCLVVYVGSHNYSTRAALFITIGVLFIALAYQVIRIRHKYKIRTFSEIIDIILSSGWSKQLFALLILSTIAFLFSWALIDSISELYWNGADSSIDSHHSFWLTICYFFDPGNLNITNHINPGIQGVVSLIVTILGMTLLTGLFVSTFTNIIEQRVDSVKSGAITYKGIHSHFVIIGFCKLTEAIIRGILEKYGKSSKILLLTKEDINTVRESLYDILKSKQHDGQLVIYSGDYNLSENLKRLNLSTSREIYLLGEESKENNDFKKYTCYQKIDKLISGHITPKDINPIPVYVRMDDIITFSTFQRLDTATISLYTQFKPFNSSEFWARKIWNGGEVEISDSFNQIKKITYPYLNINDESKYVHLVVFGFNSMAQALVIQAIRSAHFFNYTEKNKRVSKITIVDSQIKELWLHFTTHFKNLEQVYDIEIETIECEFEESNNNIIDWSRDQKQKLIIAICSDNQNLAFERALNLPTDVYYQHKKKSTELPIVYVEQTTYSSVWELAKKTEQIELYDKVDNPSEFRSAQYDKYHNVYPFGMKIRRVYPNKIEDLKSCLIHADYEALWCNTNIPTEEKTTIAYLYKLVEHNETVKLESLINNAFSRWYKLSENIKSANRYQTDNHKQILLILKKNGITSVEHVSNMNDELLYLCSDIEHRRWIGERVIAGWQQSPYRFNGKIMRQDSLRMHYDIRKTSEIDGEISKDDNVIINVLMLDKICQYIIDNNII